MPVRGSFRYEISGTMIYFDIYGILWIFARPEPDSPFTGYPDRYYLKCPTYRTTRVNAKNPVEGGLGVEVIHQAIHF